LTSYFDSMLDFDLYHHFRKKVGLQGFIKKFITPEPLEINNDYFLIEFLKAWSICCVISEIFCVSYAYSNFSKLRIKNVENLIFLNGNYNF
jgi:hypothetical protein